METSWTHNLVLTQCVHTAFGEHKNVTDIYIDGWYAKLDDALLDGTREEADSIIREFMQGDHEASDIYALATLVHIAHVRKDVTVGDAFRAWAIAELTAKIGAERTQKLMIFSR